jgi:hypothetical protein
MKIILTAFNGRMRSDPMDMVLDTGVFTRGGFSVSDKPLDTKPSMPMRCRFEDINKVCSETRAKIYQLVDITK